MVIANLSRHTDPLSPERRFGRPELCPVVSEDHRSEGRIGVRPPEIQECRLGPRIGRELSGRDHAADRGVFSDVARCILRV